MIEINGTYLAGCPFCGSESLRIEKKSAFIGRTGLDMRVERHTCSVRCNTCKARGGTSSGKVIGWQWRWFPDTQMPEWATTDKEIREVAVQKWNRREGEKNDGL